MESFLAIIIAANLYIHLQKRTMCTSTKSKNNDAHFLGTLKKRRDLV